MKTARSEFGIYTPVPLPARSNDESAVAVIGGEESFTDPTGVSSSVRSTIRILVIDDDRTLREGCASLLQVEGYNVTTSGRGDEAIEMIRRVPFDIVLCDLCMTPVPGVEILKAALDYVPTPSL